MEEDTTPTPQTSSDQVTQTQAFGLENENIGGEEVPGEDHNSQRCWGELVLVGSAKDSVKESLSGPIWLKGDEKFVIGRSEKCNIQIIDPHVSTKHVTFTMDQQANIVWVEDSSTCGTFLNGQKLTRGSRHRVMSGDALSLVKPRVSGDKGHEFIFRRPDREVAKEHQSPCKGEINSKYEVLEQIGSGSYATVRKGIRRNDGLVTAVKIIERGQFKMDPEKWEEQFKEIAILKKLDHPSITKLLDVYQTEDALYIVLEYVPGGELFDRILENGPYRETEARVVVSKILAAVAYLHSLGVIHRDLKPENILLPDKDKLDVKIADFGVAKDVSTGKCKTVIGSMSYIAPEVLARRDTIAGKGHYGEGADMWSIGVITYAVLMGRLPFSDDGERNMHEAIDDVLKFTGKAWAEISDAGKDFISGIFQLDPGKRFDVHKAINHVWISGEMKARPITSGNKDGSSSPHASSSSTEQEVNWTRERKGVTEDVSKSATTEPAKEGKQGDSTDNGDSTDKGEGTDVELDLNANENKDGSGLNQSRIPTKKMSSNGSGSATNADNAINGETSSGEAGDLQVQLQNNNLAEKERGNKDGESFQSPMFDATSANVNANVNATANVNGPVTERGKKRPTSTRPNTYDGEEASLVSAEASSKAYSESIAVAQPSRRSPRKRGKP